MSNQKPGFRFRMPSWFAPASASSGQPPPQKSSNPPESTPPPATRGNDTSSAAAKQASPSDDVQKRNKSRNGTTPPASTAAQKTPFKPPGKAAQTSKTKPDPLPQSRKTSQARPDKPASPTKLNTPPSSPPTVALQQKETPVKPTPKTPPRLPPTSKETASSRPRPNKAIDHESKSADEVILKSSPAINSPKSVTQLPKSEPISAGELKPTDEVNSKPSSPKNSPQSATIDSSLAQANIPSNDVISGQPKEQIPTNQGVLESPIPIPGPNSSNINHQKEKFPESQLKPEIANQVIEKAQEPKDKEAENEKKVINELQMEESGTRKQIKEQQSMAVQPKHANGVAAKNVAKSTPHRDANEDSFQEHTAFKGDDFSINKATKNDKPQFRQIKTSGDEVRSREERQMSVITMAGENRGATMEIGPGSSKRNQGLPIHRGYKLNNDETTESNTGAERNPNGKESNKQRPIGEKAPEMYINSNLQTINNSIMFNSSITQGDPGVHIVQSRTPVESNDTPNKKKTHAHKADFNVTKAQQLTYEPNIRRRCLRGLLLESSDDSDQDNTGKSRRHGCRVACNERNQSNNVNIL